MGGLAALGEAGKGDRGGGQLGGEPRREFEGAGGSGENWGRRVGTDVQYGQEGCGEVKVIE